MGWEPPAKVVSACKKLTGWPCIATLALRIGGIVVFADMIWIMLILAHRHWVFGGVVRWMSVAGVVLAFVASGVAFLMVRA